MNVRILILAAAVAVAVPAAARAQSPNANDAADEPGYGTLIASLQAADAELAELQALEGVALADVRVVTVGEVVAGESEAFDHAIEESREDVVALQEFLNTTDIEIVGDENVALSFDDVLGQSDAGVGDVVAVQVSGGQVILFVLDPATEETAAEEMIG